MKQKKAHASTDPKTVVPYKLTDQEQEAVAAHLKLIRSSSPLPGIKIMHKGNKYEFDIDHPDEDTGLLLLEHSLGTTSTYFADGLVNQLVKTVIKKDGAIDNGALNFSLAVIDGIKPKDQLETMLASQMAAIHMATLNYARSLAAAETIIQRDSAERGLNKLARTFTTQMEALKKYRSTGEQRVTVQHVTVNEGGQAIVGTVERSKDQGEEG